MRTPARILSGLIVTLAVGWTMIPRIAPAQLVSVNTITNNDDTLGVLFGAPVTLDSATNPANYAVFTKTGVVAITTVTLQTNAQSVRLRLATNLPEFFSLTVSNVVDAASNLVSGVSLGYLSDYGSDDVGTVGDPDPAGQVFTDHGDTFEVTVGGSDVGGTNDAFHFIHQPVVGDFDLAVVVTQLELADLESKAGLMARESLAADSRTLQTYFTAPGGANEVEVAVRASPGGPTTDAGFQSGPRAPATPLRWLRLTRTNDTFTAYHGVLTTNGVDWTVSGSTTQAFNSTLNLGMMVAAHTTNGVSTTAKFTNFEKHGVRPDDYTQPTLNAALSGTNLFLSWLRTPRDFAVQASTNLISTNWAFVLLPIFEDPTNAALRSMQVPLSLLTNRSWFFRLARVERVIPDPPWLLYTGIILSPGLGLDGTSVPGDSLCFGGLICSTPQLCSSTVNMNLQVNSAYATIQPSCQVIAVQGTPVDFSTAQCNLLVDSALQIRRMADFCKCCDDDTAGLKKAVVVVTTTQASMENNFGIILAPKLIPASGYGATGVLRVKITYPTRLDP